MASYRPLVLSLVCLLAILQVDLTCPLLMTTSKRCLATGLDVLRETRDIKRFRATFDLETRKVYYKVKFCKQFAVCFASTIDHDTINEDIVNKIESWAKIIRVIQGKGHFMPYIRQAHAKEYGGPRDYYNCTNRFYIITFKPSPVDIQAVTKTLPRKHCLSGRLCSRTCLHKTGKKDRCHEVRIACNFKCSKRRRKARFTSDVSNISSVSKMENLRLSFLEIFGLT
eukprot:Seg2311.4 transcript_id=Seg2311.4/GoldUCD/mRNA.D3Y31 product="hypothetical protein" protein_id=Seg2311.4/GoldUCD/D3Y31